MRKGCFLSASQHVFPDFPHVPAEGVVFTSCPVCRLAEELKDQRGIWVCGGAAVAQPLIRGGLIDEYRISIIPTILGGGIPLFGQSGAEIPLKFTGVRSSDGITELTYCRREPATR